MPASCLQLCPPSFQIKCKACETHTLLQASAQINDHCKLYNTCHVPMRLAEALLARLHTSTAWQCVHLSQVFDESAFGASQAAKG